MLRDELPAGATISQIFRHRMAADPALTPRDLDILFSSEFPSINPAASIAIGRWGRAGGGAQFPDALPDTLIAHYLAEGGYTL